MFLTREIETAIQIETDRERQRDVFDLCKRDRDRRIFLTRERDRETDRDVSDL